MIYLSQGEQKQPYRGRLPFGQVPTYGVGNVLLFASSAIVHHVANTHGDTLLPADTAARAVERMSAARNTTEPPIMDHAIAALFEREEPWSAPRLLSILDRIDERTDPPRSCAIRAEGHTDARVIRSSVQTARISESRCVTARSASPNRCMWVCMARDAIEQAVSVKADIRIGRRKLPPRA